MKATIDNPPPVERNVTVTMRGARSALTYRSARRNRARAAQVLRYWRRVPTQLVAHGALRRDFSAVAR